MITFHYNKDENICHSYNLPILASCYTKAWIVQKRGLCRCIINWMNEFLWRWERQQKAPRFFGHSLVYLISGWLTGCESQVQPPQKHTKSAWRILKFRRYSVLKIQDLFLYMLEIGKHFPGLRIHSIHLWISKNPRLSIWISMIFGCQYPILLTSLYIHIDIPARISMQRHYTMDVRGTWISTNGYPYFHRCQFSIIYTFVDIHLDIH